MLAASNGISAEIGGWGYECPQHRDLRIAIGPDGSIRSKAGALRAPINPSISKGCTEVEPSCPGLEQPAGRTADAIGRLLQRHRLHRHRSLLGLEPVDHVAARQGMGRIRSDGVTSSCTHPGPDGRPIFTARTPDVPQACAAAAALASPSAKSLVIPTVSLPVQSDAQGEHPVVGVVQRFGGWSLLL
jgi:hypothetical protein